MPYERPGAAAYVTATKVTNHNEPATENGLVGVAVKQKAAPWASGLAAVQVIEINEPFVLRTKGTKQVSTAAGAKGAALAGAAQGAAVYIATADNTLALAGGAGLLPFGRVTERPGDGRGVPDNTIRIDLDQKDTLT